MGPPLRLKAALLQVASFQKSKAWPVTATWTTELTESAETQKYVPQLFIAPAAEMLYACRQRCRQLWDVVAIGKIWRSTSQFVFTICLRQTSATWRSECENSSSRNHLMHVPEDWHSNFQHTKFRPSLTFPLACPKDWERVTKGHDAEILQHSGSGSIYHLWLFKGFSERRVTLKPLIHHFPPSHCHLMMFYEHWPSQQLRVSKRERPSQQLHQVIFSKQKLPSLHIFFIKCQFNFNLFSWGIT